MKYLVIGLNLVYCTLNERLKLSSPNILLRIIYTQANTHDKIGLVQDTSLASNRYNILNVTATNVEANEDLANGIFFIQPGNYHYEIYESSDTNLDITGKCLIEKGIIRYDHDEFTECDLGENINEIVL